MAAKLKIKKGDTVFVVAGRERGKSGKVTRVGSAAIGFCPPAVGG